MVLLSLCMMTSVQVTNGIILYSGDNSENLSLTGDPRETIFNSVARICNANRGGAYGSAVHIRGKYLLTANHVSLGTHLTFNGSDLYALDLNFTPRRIGVADMKLIKLIEDPMLPEMDLNEDALADIGIDVTLVGWGVGRDPDVNDAGFGSQNIWAWGNSSTFTKRWGTNRTESTYPPPLGGPEPVSYDYLYTELSARNNEAGAAIFDSGSGLFANIGNTWKLIGLTTAVGQQNAGASTFSSFVGDENYFVRISTYVSDIEAAIPDITHYSDWKIDHSLYEEEANDTTDTDGDGIPQLLEFALGGDPRQNDRSILPIHQLIEENGETYLEIKLTRPKNLQEIEYIPETTTQLSDWPGSSIGIVDSNPFASDNGNGTETLVYRRSQNVSSVEKAFIRITINETL